MLKPEQIVEVGPFWTLAADISISSQAREHGTIAFDPVFLKLPELDTLPPQSLVIDAGAFIGDTTRIFLDKGFRVAAFEPQPDAFECLAHNCPDAGLFNVALGDGRTVDLHGGQGGNMGARPVFTGTTMPTVRLDNLNFSDVALLKLDCEGFEPAILSGAVELLRQKTLRYVICEFNPKALEQYGWTCDDILQFLSGWRSREIFRYGVENWDLVFWRDQ